MALAAQRACSHSWHSRSRLHVHYWDLILDHRRGFGGPLGARIGRAPARSYDEYLKAYSVAMLPGRERENLSYGGKSMSVGLSLFVCP